MRNLLVFVYWSIVIAFATLVKTIDLSFGLWRFVLLCVGAYPLFTLLFGLKLHGNWGGPYSYSNKDHYLMLLIHHLVGALFIFFALVG